MHVDRSRSWAVLDAARARGVPARVEMPGVAKHGVGIGRVDQGEGAAGEGNADRAVGVGSGIGSADKRVLLVARRW